MSEKVTIDVPGVGLTEFPSAEAAEQYFAQNKPGQTQNVIATTEDGGRFVRGSDGRVSFASPGYATSDPQRVNELLEGASIKDVVQSGFDQQLLQDYPAISRLNEFVRGAPFVGSYLDEAVGTVSPQAREAMRASTGAMQREKPGQTTALNIGGGLAFTAPVAAAAPAIAGTRGGQAIASAVPKSMLGRSVVGAAAGSAAAGTEGAIYGYGEGETPGGRREESARQAKVGGIFGGLLGAAAPAAGDFFQSLAQRWKSRDIDMIAREFGVSKDSARVLKRAFQNNDQQAFDRITRAGSEATLADAGRSGSALLDASAQVGGRPLNIVDDAVGARANRSLSTVTDSLDEALGPVRGPRQAARDVARSTAPARNAAYDAAYATPINYADDTGRAVEDVLSRLDPSDVNSAVQRANRNMRLEGRTNMQILFDMDNGTFREMPNVQQLDEIKKALDEMGADAVDNLGRPNADGRYYRRAAQMLRDATKDATGGEGGTYAAALAQGQGKVEMDRALDFGLEMLRDSNRTTKEVVQETLANMSSDGRAMMKVGLRSYIDDLMGRVKIIASNPDSQDARQAMAALKALSSGNARAKLRLLLGPEQFNRLMPKLDEAIASQGMVADVAGNSRTALRTAIRGEVEDITSPGLLGQLTRGEPVEATKRLAQELLSSTPGDDAARMEQIWSEVAQVLSERRGSKSAAAALRYIQKAMDGQPLKEAEARMIAQEVMTGLPVAGGRSVNQYLSTNEGALPR